MEFGRTGFGPHPTPGPPHPAGPWAPLTRRRKGRPGEVAAPNGLRGASLPGGGRRVASVGPAGGGGAAKEALAAGSDPRGAAARLACNAPTSSAARCPLTSGGSSASWNAIVQGQASWKPAWEGPPHQTFPRDKKHRDAPGWWDALA
ncbi:hypothetical protein LEMLEM_LOCUS26192 [Lemmus lemmus]